MGDAKAREVMWLLFLAAALIWAGCLKVDVARLEAKLAAGPRVIELRLVGAAPLVQFDLASNAIVKPTIHMEERSAVQGGPADGDIGRQRNAAPCNAGLGAQPPAAGGK